MKSFRLKKFSDRKSPDQAGLASIVIVGILIILLTIISFGFAKLMDRSVNNSLNNQLSTAASYAAQSGLNDAIAYLKLNPTASATKCNDLLTVSALGPSSNLSGDGNTKYTCVLINPTPADLVYQNLPPYKSEVVRLDTLGGPVDNLMFSWQSNDRSKTGLPPGGSKTLFDETTWGDASHNYEPVLRLTLYPIPTNKSIAGLQAASRTFFLYPTNTSGNITNLDYTTTGDGRLSPVNCGKPLTVTGFAGTADYDCNVVISKLKNVSTDGTLSYFYARITPLYVSADVKIKANDATPSALQFQGVEAVIDVTGKANTAAKRLQARVNVSSNGDIAPGDDAIPENVLRSAKTICKRLVVSDTGTTSVDGTKCDTGIIVPPAPPPAPTITLTPSPPSITAGGSSTLTWTSTDATSCSATWTISTSSSGTQVVSPPVTTTYDITCTGPGGTTTVSTTVTVNPIGSPPPPPPPPPGPPGPPSGGACPNPQGGTSSPGISDPCMQDIIFTGVWADPTTVTLKVWGRHCYGGMDINGNGIGWLAVPSDNSDYYIYNVPFPSGGGTATGTCHGTGTSYSVYSIFVPAYVPPAPPPPPQCPSPPGPGPCPLPPPPLPPHNVFGCDWGGGAYDADISSAFCRANGGSWGAWCMNADGSIRHQGVC